MKIRAIVFATFLSWVAFDTNLFRKRSGESFRMTEDTFALGEDIVKKRVRKLRKHRNVIPPWMLEGRAKIRTKVNHFNAYSLDPRDSDQRKIRRKINNA